ncbi:HD domain-containing protein, partial [Micromonospora sp. NPDC005413]|uniref:HD domain-containing protein n=1 Tax=Micromonospora sp. NPDC005413 TaxID=3154563 RepID=UPI0033BEDADB
AGKTSSDAGTAQRSGNPPGRRVFHAQRGGNLRPLGRRGCQLTAAPNIAVTADQVADCPPAVADAITAAVTEYEAQETLEAIVARDADKLECLVQAVEYRNQGIDNVQRWIDSSRAALKTTSAHRLADAALAGQPLAWLTPPPPPT